MKEKQEKTFAEQVDDVLNGADTSSSHLEVLKETPPLLRMVGVPNLPILMTARHVKAITQDSGSDSANYHGLGIELIKQLPELISDPVMIMDSLTRNDSIVVVSQTVDKENRPIIGAIKLDGRGNDINGIEISANILTSAYGRNGFQSFIERNIEQGSVLYVDKEKSQELFETPGIQFPDNIESLSFNTIIRKSRAFVNMQEQKNSKNTKKEGENMNTDVNISPREKVQQIRDGMVKTLIDYIGKNPTNWQSGWVATGVPVNGKTKTPYRGINSLYLALIGMQKGFSDPRWVTFNQAKDMGASVKRGEQSVPVVFFEFYDRATKRTYDSRTVKNMTDEDKKAYLKENVYAVLKYSRVFNAAQCENFPERTAEYKMPEEERAQQNALIETIIVNSAAPIAYDGGNQAYYSPVTDSIHLPAIDAYKSMQDYYATALHEIAHSTGHETRLNRDLSGGKGSESYAKEELRAELACVFMQLEQGLQLEGKHIENHAAYLSSWMEAVQNDASVFTKAAADAQKIADYVAEHYLQSVNADVLESVAITEEENTEQKTAEFNPISDYLRAEPAKLETIIATRLQENVKEWYTSNYPTDTAGNDINALATFKDLQEQVDDANVPAVYGMLANDSVIRERAFAHLSEITGMSNAEIYERFSGITAAQKLANARAQAQRLAVETGEPYVTVEWTEKSNGFPYINDLDVMPLSEADKTFAALDKQSDKEEGYYKTKLHIDFVLEGKLDSYENCRFYIGVEGGGLVHHIDEFLKNDTFLNAEQRSEAENALEYFKTHIDLSSMVDTAISNKLPSQDQYEVQRYVLTARKAVNSAIPFSTYKLPEMSAFEQEESKAESGEHKEKNPLNENVKEWYTSTFPNDEVGATLNNHITFADINESVFNPTERNANIYEVLDVTTSEVREREVRDRVFTRLAEIKGVTYDAIFNEWAQLDYHTQLAAQHRAEQVGEHKEKLTLEEARNAMLDAQSERQSYYAVRIENVPYTDPEDGYESEEPAQVIYIISEHGNIREYKTIPLDSDVFSSDLPYGDYISYEPVEYEELEEIAKKVREPIQTFKDVLREEVEADAKGRRSDAYYDQRVDDILDEHYRTEHGLFKRDIENPKYLSGTLYAEETFRGERVVSLTKDESGKNVAIITRVGGGFVVAEDYRPEDGRRWGKAHYFDDQKSAEEFRAKNFPSAAERVKRYQALAASKSPLGQEYARIKGENADSVVFYRVGDFFEVLGADAERVAEKLELTLTGRTIGTEERVPMCGVPYHAIDQYVDTLAKKGENVIVADGTDIRKHETKIDLTEKRLKDYADTLRRNDLEVGNAAQSDEYYLQRAREEIAAYEQSDEYKQTIREDFPKDFIDDTPTDMPQVTQNEQHKQTTPLNTELANKTTWLKINMPDGTVGKEYGKNTLIKMPEGEFKHFALFVPTRFLKQDSENGKWQLNVGASFTYRLNNDGRQVELTGQELVDSFNGMQLNKDAVRVAPSWKNAQALANIEKNVPGEMRAIPNWCVFRTRSNPERGKRDKFLLSAKDGHWVKVNEPDRWTDFETAMQYAKASNCEGLSFVLDGKSGITCIDLDKCIDADGNFNGVAKKLTDEIKGTYVEKSVSGNGVHIWLKDDVLKGKYKNSATTSDGEIEVYDSDHIISITGNMLSDTNALGKCPMSTMNYLRGALGEKLQQTLSANRNARQGYQAGSDREVVERIRKSKKGAEFDELYSGKGLSGDRSRDDMKLANILAFFTDGDAAQTLRIMKESGLYRPDKPDDYYIHTIGKAIDTLIDRPKYGAAADAGKGKNRGNDGAAH